MSDHKKPSGRLREAGVREIRERRKKGGPEATYHAIANAMGVSIGTVYNIVTGKTWGWLP
jgi:AcrR family transcriptional regulator